MHKFKSIIFKNLIFSLLFVFCQGCSNTYWVNNRSNANWNIESAQCEAYANGNAPNPAMQAYDYGGTFSGSGVVGSTPYFYSGTIAPDHAYNMQAGLNNAANAFTALAARQNIYEQCLRSLGWVQASKQDIERIRNTPPRNAIKNNFQQFILALENENFLEAEKILQIEAQRGITPAKSLLRDLSSNNTNIENERNVILGLYYIEIERNFNKGKQFIEEAVNNGSALGLLALGEIYRKGLGESIDYKKAKELYEKAVAKKCPEAFNQLGYLYLEGLGTYKDNNKSKNYFNKAIDLGYDPALDSMGELYEKGFKNKQIALSYYEKACNKNVQEGCDNYNRLSQE